MKTNKYNNMIEAFACDFDLAIKGKRSLVELQDLITGKSSLSKDIDLLCELDWMLRNGKAEIHIIE